MPVASKMALPMAGAMATIGVSPAPADGRSLRSSRTTSICGRVAEPRDAIARKAGVGDPAVLEFDGLEERAADSHDHGAFDLVLEMVGVDDGAALECADGADDLHAAVGRVDGDLGAGGDVSRPFRTRPRCRCRDRRRSSVPSRRPWRRPRSRRGAARP